MMLGPRKGRRQSALSAAGCLLVAALTAAPANAFERQPDRATAPTQAREPAAVTLAAPGSTQELTLRDGSVLYGRVESIADDTIVFRTLGQVAVTVRRTDVAAVRTAEGRVVDREFVPADPNATRLFFGPTGRALPKGRAYVGVYEFLLPFVQVGLTDRLSVGAGTPLVFGVEGEHPFWLTPKLQLLGGDRVQVAAGLFQVLNAGEDSFGIAYGVGTFGDADRAVTVGAGWGYWSRDAHDPPDARTGTPVVMVGAERRVSRRLKVVTENYVFDDGGIVSGGVRFIGDRLSADLGLVLPLGIDDTMVFPVVNFVWVF